VLRAGLDGAVRDGLLAKNPAAAVKRPGVARKEAMHASAVDVTKLLLCARRTALPQRAHVDRSHRHASR
jgi:integrase